MCCGHKAEILVLNLTTQVDTTGIQSFEDLKRKIPVFFLWDSTVFGRLQII
jgi:hypothetical protein